MMFSLIMWMSHGRKGTHYPLPLYCSPLIHHIVFYRLDPVFLFSLSTGVLLNQYGTYTVVDPAQRLIEIKGIEL